MTYRGPISRAVGAALTAAQPKPEDAGAVALVRRYAALLDEAAVDAKYAEAVAAVNVAVAVLDDPATARHWRKLVAALEAHSVASDLGPKLLAALTALGMTAAGRTVRGGVPSAPALPGVAAALDEFTARRTGQHHA